MCCNNIINNNINNGEYDNSSNSSSCSNCNLPTNNIRCGSSYVPVQIFRNVYSPTDGLSYGTMFPELVRTYYPNQSLAEMTYLRNSNERRCGC